LQNGFISRVDEFTAQSACATRVYGELIQRMLHFARVFHPKLAGSKPSERKYAAQLLSKRKIMAAASAALAFAVEDIRQ